MVAELSSLKEALRSRGQELQDLQVRLTEAQGLLAEYGKECDQLKVEREVLKSQLDAAGSSARSQDEGERAALQQELDRARGENAELQARAAELEGQLDAFRAEYQTVETDEAATRALAERLARRRPRWRSAARTRPPRSAPRWPGCATTSPSPRAGPGPGRRRRGADPPGRAPHRERRPPQGGARQGARERVHLAAQQVTNQEELTRLRDELGAAQAGSKELTELRLAASAERSRSASLERLLAESKSQLERVRQKERDLRRLVSLVSTQAQDEEVIIVNEGPTPARPAPKRPPPAWRRPRSRLRRRCRCRRPRTPRGPRWSRCPAGAAGAGAGRRATGGAGGGAGGGAPHARSGGAAGGLRGPDGSRGDGGPVRRSAGRPVVVVVVPGRAAAVPAGALPRERRLAGRGAFRGGPRHRRRGRSPRSRGQGRAGRGRGRRRGLRAALREGRSLRTTPAFEDYKPETEAEAQVSAWLRAAFDLPALVTLSRGAVAEEHLMSICLKFRELGLIELEPS
jgi:hypothetical protein